VTQLGDKFYHVGGARPAGSPTTIYRKWVQGQKAGAVNVPCGSCNACCRSARMTIQVLPREGKHVEHTVDEQGNMWLAKRPDGTCVYLADGKCSIYAKRPLACRTYDCRVPNLLFGWLDAHDPIMREAIGEWARLKVATVDDGDMLVAMRLAMSDGGLPSTAQEHARKVIWQDRWMKYLPRARELRALNDLLNKQVTVDGKEGTVIAVTMEGHLIVDLRSSGGNIIEVKLHAKLTESTGMMGEARSRPARAAA
jgi:Fe-S-cluster containining protein